jgi:uncharacterized protein YgiM (DUF1202 family)
MKKLFLLLLLVLLVACAPAPGLDDPPARTATPEPLSTQTPPQPSPTPHTAAVCADWLNVRQQAGVAHPVVSSLERGQTVTLQSTTRTADGATWARTDNGWVNTKYLCKENP